MTRVLWWSPEYPPDPGGIATFAGHIAPAVAASGHEVIMLVVHGESEDRYVADRLRVRREPIRVAFEAQDPRMLMQLQRRVRAIKIDAAADLYHVHLCEPSPLLHLTSIDTVPAPTVLTLHSQELDGGDFENPETLLHRLFDLSSVITCVSAAATRRFAALAPRFAHRLVTIPNGAPVAGAVDPCPPDPRLVAIGRLGHEKGFDRLLSAMPAVIAAVPDVHLDLLGSGPEGPALAAQIDNLGLAQQVTMRGHVPRDSVPEWISRARLVVAPSRYEGLPYVALEAAGNARALVATKVSGIEDVVVDGLTGLLVDSELADDDPDELSSAIVELLLDPDRCEQMGRAGRARVERSFSLDACAEAYLTAYRCALEPVREVAVVITVHDGERHLAASLESVLAEIEFSGVDGQIVVINDGSTDSSAEIAASYADRGVIVFSQPHLGAGLARNAGIALTSSTWVAHLDADDLWPRGRLRCLLDAIEGDAGGEIEAVFGRAVEFADADAPPTVHVETDPRAVQNSAAGLVRRSAYERIGGFDPSAPDDLIEWSMRALDAGLRHVQIDGIVLERRIHARDMRKGP